jgi:glutamine amidotransferase
MISVVDYGVANLGSMLNMLRKVGAPAELVSTPEAVLRAERIVLPGIGAFDHGIDALAARGLIDPLRSAAGRGVPLLGVCLGMQLLGLGSEEGEREGLGLLPIRCRRFRPPDGSRLKVPHMGWNTIIARRSSPLLAGLGEESRFYFVHSFHCVCEHDEDVLAVSPYGEEFVSVVERGAIRGVQFHPEKSHRYGMVLLRNFASPAC